MNNTTIIESHPNLDYAIRISTIAWRTCGILCTLFGITGNLFLLLIKTNKTSQKEPISLYHCAIAICETVFLLGIFWLWCVGMSIIKTDPRDILSCGLFYNILMGPITLSNLYIASISIDRTFMILYPTRYRVVITRRHVFIRILVILLIVIIIMIPNHYYYYYYKKTTIFICDIHRSNSYWRIRIWPLLHSIFFVSVPSIITCISSIILLHNRRNHRRIHKNNLSENARRMERNSILLLFFSITLLVSILPFVILEICIIYDRLFYLEDISSIKWKTYKILLNCFLILGAINYSFKFYIHLIISTPFRNQFIQLFQQKEKLNEQNFILINKQYRTKSTEI